MQHMGNWFGPTEDFDNSRETFRKGGMSYGNEEEGYEEGRQEEKAVTDAARL